MITIPNHQFNRLINTHPVLIVSSRKERYNNFAALSWYAPLSVNPPMVGISLKPSSASYQYIREAGDFVLAVPSEEQVRSVHFCAAHSGHDMDKLRHLNFPTTRGKQTSPLLISNSLGHIECRVRDIHAIGDRPWITGEVLSASIDPNFFDLDRGWNERAKLLYHEGGNLYRSGNQLHDMSDVRPGYVPPDAMA